jgi:hypothetical protein
MSLGRRSAALTHPRTRSCDHGGVNEPSPCAVVCVLELPTSGAPARVATASAIVRTCEADTRADALSALHALARDVVGVGVPAALAQTRLAGGDPLLVGEAHRRLPRLHGARSSNDESICIIGSLP